MSEKVINQAQPKPEELEQYKAIVLEGDSEGQFTVTGVYRNNHRRELPVNEFIESFGIDPNKKQPFAKGIWKVNDYEIPVNVVGFAGRIGDEDYLKVDGSNTAIPRSQIQWLESTEPSVAAPSEKELTELLKEQDRRISDLESRLQAISTANSELREENKQLQKRNEMLEALLRENGITVPSAEDAPQARVVDSPSVAEAEPRALEEPVVDVGETEVQVEPEKPETEDQRSWWQRARDRVMGPVYGSHARAATITRRKRYEYDDQNRVIVEEEESNEQQRRVGLMAGATALAGAAIGLGLGYLIWHKTGHDVNTYYDFNLDIKPGSLPDTTDVIPGVPGTGGGSASAANSISGSHIDYHNNLPGHRQTGAIFPKNLELSQDNAGHDIIINKTTKAVVVSHEDLPHGMFDSQRKLSRMAMAILRRKGHSVVDGGQDPGHMSIVLES